MWKINKWKRSCQNRKRIYLIYFEWRYEWYYQNHKVIILNYATSQNEPQRTITSHNEPQQTTTNHNEPQPLTTNHKHPIPHPPPFLPVRTCTLLHFVILYARSWGLDAIIFGVAAFNFNLLTFFSKRDWSFFTIFHWSWACFCFSGVEFAFLKQLNKLKIDVFSHSCSTFW